MFSCLWILGEKVLDSCSFRDEDDDCTYQYTVEPSEDPTANELIVEVLEKKGEHAGLELQSLR